LQLAGRAYDQVVLHTFFDDETLVRCIRTVKESAEQAGRDPATVEVWSCLATIGDHLPEPVRLTRFVNLPKELDADEGELTRTRKLKRDFIAQRYGVLIDAMYEGRDKATIEIPVRYQDGRSGVLRADVTPAQVPAHA
jgi:long-chain acyl-CoA synthetase